jgi:long-chain fatty acid transport protein
MSSPFAVAAVARQRSYGWNTPFPTHPKWTAVALAVAGLAWIPDAASSGFFVNQQSVRSLGRVNAGVAASADDPSTMYFNAANLAYLWCPAQRASLSLPCTEAPRDRPTADLASFGVQLIIPRSTLDNSGSEAATLATGGLPVAYSGSNFKDPTDPTPVPNLYWAHRISNDLFVGIAMGAPFGLAAKYDNQWFGRYDSIEVSLFTVNVDFVAAYRISPSIAIGGGLDIQYAKTKLVQAIPNPLVPGGPTAATDGQISIEGTAWTPGFNLGVMFTPDDATRIGLSFRSEMNHKISGDATTSGLTGPLAAFNGELGADAKLKLPAIASIGAVRQMTPELTLYAQYEWYGWSNFNEIVTTFSNGSQTVRQANYRDSFAIAVGGDYALQNGWVLRGGFRYDRTPTTDGYRDTAFPDADRYWLGLGASYTISPKWTVDLAFNQVWFPTANIDVTRNFEPIPAVVRVKGTADLNVNTVSVSFKYSW